MAPSSFGLHEKSKQFLLDELYALVEHCNITYTEAWKMPVAERRYWLDKKIKEQNSDNKNAEAEKAAKTSPAVAPEIFAKMASKIK